MLHIFAQLSSSALSAQRPEHTLHRPRCRRRAPIDRSVGGCTALAPIKARAPRTSGGGAPGGCVVAPLPGPPRDTHAHPRISFSRQVHEAHMHTQRAAKNISLLEL